MFTKAVREHFNHIAARYRRTPLPVLRGISKSRVAARNFIGTADVLEARRLLAQATFDTSTNPILNGTFNQGTLANELDQTATSELVRAGVSPVIAGLEWRGFLSFSLASLPSDAVVQSATLFFRQTAQGGPLPTTVRLFDVATPATDLNLLNGRSQTMFADLGGGATYGDMSITSNTFGALTATALNAAALTDIGANAGGFFSIGLTIIPDAADQSVVVGDNSSLPQQLIVNYVQPPQTVSLLTNTIAENSGPNTPISSFNTFDPDGGFVGHTLVTGVGDDDNDLFEISGGFLRAKQPFDFETKSSYSIRARATDATNLSSEGVLTIDVTDVNEMPTASDATFDVADGAANGTSVGSVSASDVDAGQSLSYAITEGNGTGDGAFEINPSSGAITVKESAQLDFGMTPTFSLTVEVTDDGTPMMTDTATITINVLNPGNTAPVVDDQMFSIAENGLNGGIVGDVLATDSDAGQMLTYSIVAGDPRSAFTIDPVTGQLTVARAFAIDFEDTPQFQLTVEVADDAMPSLTDTATITVDVLDTLEDDLLSMPNTVGSFFSADSQNSSFAVSRLGRLPAGRPWQNVQYGDFNGDDLVDVLIQSADQFTWHVGLNDGQDLSFSRWLAGWNSIDSVFVGDFNGDGTDDIAGRRDATARWRVGLSDGTQFIDQRFGRAAQGGNTTITEIKIADFDGDGSADRAVFDADRSHWFVNHSSTNVWSAWGDYWTRADLFGNWQVADFNGDGLADIAGIGAVAGNVKAAFSDATNFSTTNATASTFTPAASFNWFGVGDFDADGAAELVGKNAADTFFVSQVNEVGTSTSEQWGSWPSNGIPVSHPTVGDFNGDGLADIAGIRGQGGRFQMLLSDDHSFRTAIWDGGFPAAPVTIEGFVSGQVVPAGGMAMLHQSESLLAVTDGLFEDDDELVDLLAGL